MEKVIIKHDFYETARLVNKTFGLDINGCLTSGGEARAATPPEGILCAYAVNKVICQIGPRECVAEIDFICLALGGYSVTGKYLYRRCVSGIDVMCGVTVIKEEDKA